MRENAIRRVAWLLPLSFGMRRALRNTETSMFIKSDGKETVFIELARSFESYDEAIVFCKRKNLKDVELVVQFPSSTEQLTVPISEPAN